ncbi:MAG TPA: restriction endonuclease subunit S [Thermoanaerobaculia bacterium]|nr:restriction endonuclease subunit S [Thermoanaerobaculia bacterium]
MTAVSTIALGEIMATKSGAVDPSMYPDEVFDLYSIPAFDRRQPEVVSGSSIGSAKQIVAPGDVLLSKIVPHIRRSWVVGGERGRRIIASGEWIVFRSDRMHPHYLRQVLLGDPFHVQFMRTVSGVGGSLLRARPAHVAKIEIPFPPLAEQRRIAKLLDRAEALRAKRRTALAQLDTLTQAIFLDLFGDPATNPKGWAKVVLGDVATFVGGGTPSRACPEYFTGSICWATSKDMKGEFLDDTEEHITEGALKASATKLVPAGTLLVVVKSKVLAHHLPVAVVRVPTCFGQDLKGIIPGERCEVSFVGTALRLGKRWLLERARGINTEGLTLDHLRAFPLPLPPLSLQHDFARRVAAVETLKAAHRASLAELDALFSSLQHRTFQGGL